MDQSDQNNPVAETQTIGADRHINVPPKKTRVTSFMVLLLAFLIAIGICFCYFHNRSKQQYQQELRNGVMLLQSKLAQQQLAIDAIQKNVRLLPTLETNFILAERVYDLIVSANDLLLIKNDMVEALRQLLIANNLIANNADFAPLKLVLATDIAKLQQASNVTNVEATLVRLADLNKSFINLQQYALQPKVAPVMTKNNYENYPFWQRIFLVAKASLQNVVKIDDQPAAPFLPPKQLTNLIVNLQAEIIQAQWAIIRGQNDFYKASLQNVINSLSAYFSPRDTIVANANKNLRELININLPKNLTVNASLDAAQKILLNLNNLQK